MDPLLGLGTFLLGDEEVPLPLGLFDLVVELPERPFEFLGLLSVGRSQSRVCLTSSSNWARSFRSSAMAAATSRLALANWSLISRMI